MIYTHLYHPVVNMAGWEIRCKWRFQAEKSINGELPIAMFGDRGFWDHCTHFCLEIGDTDTLFLMCYIVICRVIYRMIPKLPMILWDAMIRYDMDNIYIYINYLEMG